MPEIIDGNLGRVSARLGLQDRLLGNGMADIPLKMRSEVVEGMMNGLFQKGDWERAVGLYETDAIRLLYPGSRADFKKRLEEAVGESMGIEHFTRVYHYRPEEDAQVNKLLEVKCGEVLCEIALREDMPLEISERLLSYMRYKIDEVDWSESVHKLAERAEEKGETDRTHRLLRAVSNHEAIEALYERLSENPSLGNIDTLFNIAAGIPYGDRTGRVRNVVDSLLDLRVGIGRKFGSAWNMYHDILRHDILIGEARLKKLRNLAVESVAESSVEDTDKAMQLLWAKKNWKENPETAYKIFTEQEYAGREVLPAAHAVFANIISRGSLGIRLHTSELEPHFEAIYKRVPKTKIKQRAFLAEELGDKEELRRLGRSLVRDKKHTLYSDWSEAYELLMSGEVELEDSDLREARAHLIEHEVKHMREDGPVDIYWIDDRDDVGYRQFYQALLEGVEGKTNPKRAYELAAKRGKLEDVAYVRGLILEREDVVASLDFFEREKDKMGYDAALEKLAVQEDVDLNSLRELIGEKDFSVDS